MKRILAGILAALLTGMTAASASAAAVSLTGEATRRSQGAAGDVVVTVEEGDIMDGALDLTEDTDLETGDTLTLSGLPENTPTKIVVGARAETGTVLVDRTTGRPVPCYVDGEGRFVALVKGDCQLDVTDNAPAYTDMPADPRTAAAIIAVSALELFVGCGDGAFHPDGILNAVQVFAVLSRLAGEPLETTGDDWARAPLAWAEARGLTEGEDPFAPLTREKLLRILAVYAGAEDDAGTWAGENGLFADLGEAADSALVTRAEFAAVIYRYLRQIVIG